MKKNILICGLIAGAIVGVMLMVSVSMCYQKGNFEGNMWVGYASMLAAFSLIFVGIKNFRDKYNQGIVSFGQAFKIGLSITLIASTVYVVVWLIDYYLFIPDFMDRYAAYILESARSAGESLTEIEDKTKEMDSYKEMYKNPLMVILMTYMEIVPVGLVVSIISALILKRKTVAF